MIDRFVYVLKPQAFPDFMERYRELLYSDDYDYDEEEKVEEKVDG